MAPNETAGLTPVAMDNGTMPPLKDDRVWIDGCFDFFHHGHAGVMLQARQLGHELYAGIHSDEQILEHKGPPVMLEDERLEAARACRWVTTVVPDAPYVTELSFISRFGCRYVVHGDDITSDSGGQDTYRFVKEAGRMKIVKRTPGISTTDLVGRMLLCNRDHHIKSFHRIITGFDDSTDDLIAGKRRAAEMTDRIAAYATDETGKHPGVAVWLYEPTTSDTSTAWTEICHGKRSDNDSIAKPGQHIVYLDGDFDLWSPGHIEYLKQVYERENTSPSNETPWPHPYGRACIVVGLHSDKLVNEHKRSNFPIMNLYERALCVIQSKYVDAVVLGAPFSSADPGFENGFTTHAKRPIDIVYRSPTSYRDWPADQYAAAQQAGKFRELPPSSSKEVNADAVVQRIMQNRKQYEERQRAKGVKAVVEMEALRLEQERAQQNGAS